MEESKFNESMKEWIEKNGLPKVIYIHPDDLPNLLPKEWPMSVKMEVSPYLQRGNVLFSSMDPGMSFWEGVAPDYEIPEVNIRITPFETNLISRIDQLRKEIHKSFGMTRDQLVIPSDIKAEL